MRHSILQKRNSLWTLQNEIKDKTLPSAHPSNQQQISFRVSLSQNIPTLYFEKKWCIAQTKERMLCKEYYGAQETKKEGLLKNTKSDQSSKTWYQEHKDD